MKKTIKLWDGENLVMEMTVKSEEQAKEFAENILNTMVLKSSNCIDYCVNGDAVMQLV